MSRETDLSNSDLAIRVTMGSGFNSWHIKKLSFSLQRSIRLLCSHNFLQTAVLLGVWRLKREADHSLLSRVEDKNKWMYASTPVYIECPRRNVPGFGRVFLMLKYTDITQNNYIQSWTVTEIMAREVWNFDTCYTLIDYQIHIKPGRNMWFL